MCFKLNTPEGSVRVLGNVQAHGLPTIPGRGIWQHGNEQVEVQTPYLDTDTLEEKLADVAEVYAHQEKNLRQKMLSIEALQLPQATDSLKTLTQGGDFEGL